MSHNISVERLWKDALKITQSEKESAKIPSERTFTMPFIYFYTFLWTLLWNLAPHEKYLPPMFHSETCSKVKQFTCTIDQWMVDFQGWQMCFIKCTLLLMSCSNNIMLSVLEQFVQLSQIYCNGPDCGSLECGHMDLNLLEFTVWKHTIWLKSPLG